MIVSVCAFVTFFFFRKSVCVYMYVNVLVCVYMSACFSLSRVSVCSRAQVASVSNWYRQADRFVFRMEFIFIATSRDYTHHNRSQTQSNLPEQ